MNVFSDFHNSGLYHSLQLLFEGRLGYNLYRPIGLEWYEEGFWAVYPSPDTAQQYLGLRQGYKPKDGTVPLNDVMGAINNVYACEDKHHLTFNNAITLETFKEKQIDIVIASIPQHIKPFKELAKMKNAKFIFQMGNHFAEVLNNLHEIPNLMASTIAIPVPSNCNAVFYHQEFETDTFKPTGIPPERKITCFINVLRENGGSVDYYSAKANLPEFEFKSYGGQCDDGAMVGIDNIAATMQSSIYGFHSKAMGDGFGHVLYNWYACGRPVITRISDYKGKLGEELLEDDITCIDLDRLTPDGLRDRIMSIAPEKYEYMCQEAYKRFTDCVDYDKEEIKIREFLDK